MDKDQEEIIRELYQLKEENRFLIEEKESLYHDRELAGELGKTLLQQNKELETKLEEMNDEQTSVIIKLEELKQENHIIRSRLETEAKAKDHHIDEIENVKENLQKQFEQESMLKQQTTEKRLKELRKEIESLQIESNKHALMEGQYKEKIQQFEEMLENARKYNKELQFAANFETDLEEQRRMCSELQIGRDALVMKISEFKNIQEQLAFDKKALRERLESMEEEMQEKNRQSQMWYNCLQEARQESGEFKAELDSLTAEMANRNFKSKGNSLFGEVEDKRLELERKFSSLQTRHECLIKTHTVTKQHLHKLKSQVATLLQVKGNTADVSQLQRVQQACARKEGELKMLVQKVKNLEKQQAENCLTSQLKDFHDAFSDFGDKKDYVDFLELQLKDEKEKIMAMQKELQTKTLLQLIESDRLRNTETQLHKAESTAEKMKAENMKYRLKIEDLKMKLQQAKQNAKSDQQPTEKSLQKSKSTSAIPKKVTLKRISPSSRDTSSANGTTIESAKAFKSSTSMVHPVHISPPVSSTSSTSDPTQSNMSESLFDEIAGTKEAEKSKDSIHVEDAPTKLNPQKEKHVRFQEKLDDSKTGGNREDVMENMEADDLGKENTGPKCKEQIPSNTKTSTNTSNSIKTAGVVVKGQRQAPTVINVGKATKNECPQQ